jgi:hypothetical protein
MPNTAQIAPNMALSLQFLAHFGPPNASHCFQAFDDSPRKNRRLARTIHGTLEDRRDELGVLNDQGAGIFITINEVSPGQRRTAENVVRVRGFFADCDDPARRQRVEAEINRRGRVPSLVVESSPGKRHYYWLTNDCPLDAFKSMQRAVAAAIDTDGSVCDLSRVMRLPGFVHRKGAPFLVRGLAISKTPHSHAEMASAYSPNHTRPALTPPHRHGGMLRSPQRSAETLHLRHWIDRHGGLVTPAVRAAIAAAQHGTRHNLMRAICCRLVPMGWPDADVHALVLPAAIVAWPDVDPQEMGDRLKRQLLWVRQQEAEKIAATAPTSERAARLVAAFGHRERMR